MFAEISAENRVKNTTLSKYVGPAYCWAEMYAGRIACCPLVCHVELSVPTGETDGRTDGRQLSSYFLSFLKNQWPTGWFQSLYGVQTTEYLEQTDFSSVSLRHRLHVLSGFLDLSFIGGTKTWCPRRRQVQYIFNSNLLLFITPRVLLCVSYTQRSPDARQQITRM